MKAATIIIALGSNRPHGRWGRPEGVLRAAVGALGRKGLAAVRVSPIMKTCAIGPGGRDFANAAMTSESSLSPLEIMEILKEVEQDFGRRGGRRWGARVLDLDLIATGNEIWPSRFGWATTQGLAVPHRALPLRAFVLAPMLAVASDWRHPILGLTTRQMHARLMKPVPKRLTGRAALHR